jgi:hypothetical protein
MRVSPQKPSQDVGQPTTVSLAVVLARESVTVSKENQRPTRVVVQLPRLPELSEGPGRNVAICGEFDVDPADEREFLSYRSPVRRKYRDSMVVVPSNVSSSSAHPVTAFVSPRAPQRPLAYAAKPLDVRATFFKHPKHAFGGNQGVESPGSPHVLGGIGQPASRPVAINVKTNIDAGNAARVKSLSFSQPAPPQPPSGPKRHSVGDHATSPRTVRFTKLHPAAEKIVQKVRRVFCGSSTRTTMTVCVPSVPA